MDTEPIRMLKSNCSECFGGIEFSENGFGHWVSCPHCGQKTKLGLDSSVTPQKTNSAIKIFKCAPEPASIPESDYMQKSTFPTAKPEPYFVQNSAFVFKRKRSPAIPLSKLTEETIIVRTQKGDTPLHRAAKNGQFDLISNHLLNIDLFKIQNNEGRTCLHVAAKYGTLHQIPRQFLTKETLAISSGTWVTGSGYQAHGDTVLHTAAINGHFDQIPKEFMTIEFLKIEATGYRNTVLQYLLMSNSLDVIPGIYTNSALLDYKNSRGRTLRQEIEAKRESEASVARVRSEPATEKQKEKLRYFGYAFDENISKGQASDALDKCVRDFPEKERAYYNRPATEDQLAQIRQFNKKSKHIDGEPYYDFEDAWPLSYGKAKDLIQEWGWLQRTKEREEDSRQNLLTLVARIDFFPRLTLGRVKKAAKALDEISPGWIQDKDRYNLLLKKVAELNPELAEKDGWLRVLLER